MKKVFVSLVVLVTALFVFASASFSQGKAKTGPDPSTIRDSDLEKDSLHNLEVARHYFKLKKAYVAALQRCEEIIAGNPVFSKIDEVLYMAGASSLRLAENKGKQASKVTSDKLREDARDYLSQLVNGYPDSSFRKQAEEDLKGLGGPKPKESKP